MELHRRLFFKGLLAASALAAFPRALWAATRPDDAFASETVPDVVTKLFGEEATVSDLITLKVPDIAENGAVVPVTVKTSLENVEAISIVVDNNPTPLTAAFELGPTSKPQVSVRIKMGESSPVQALVKSGGKLYSTSKDVKVTIGGCGG